MIIYKIINIVNNKIYIGLTTKSLKFRKWQHLSIKYSGTSALSKAIKKYGRKNFIFEQIDSAESELELIEKERFWIKKLNSLRPNGYNVLNGVEAGAALARSRYVKIICIENGKEYNSISEAAMELKIPQHSVWCVCVGRTDFAGDFTFKYKNVKKYKKAQLRRKERKLKSAEGYKQNGIKHMKKIICLSTGEIFESVKAASIKLKIDESQIVRVCKGTNKKAGGFIFAYL